jgi:hypothetical protein
MKKFAFLFAVVLCISITSFAQSRSALMKTALQNATAPDTFLLRDSVLCYLSGDADGDSAFLNDLVREKFITPDDMIYMRGQLMKNEHTVWSTDSIGGAVVLQSATLPASALSAKKAAKAWTAYFKLHKQGYYEVGKPLVSKDGMSAVVYTAFQCGANCGNGGATLFQWKNGKWVAVKNIYSWRK